MRTLIALLLLGLVTVPAAASAQSASYDIPAHVSRVDGSALLQRDGGDEELERNLTLIQGDRVRTLAGRVEILFADGTLLHLDRNTVIDFQSEDFVRVMEGRARWLVAREARAVVRVDTPAATLELDPGGDYRVAVAPNGDAELAVLRGSGALLNDHGDTGLKAGERAVVARGRAPSQAFYANVAAWDDFDRWSDTRRRDHASAVSLRYLPNELHPYGSVFDSYGSWRSHPSHGYVWYPVANAEWQPYSHGRWHSYPRYGWTWIGRDPWAWPTHHFGRWGFSAGVWFWIPGRTWGPAWVSWASSNGFVGWSPLGWNDHPIYRIDVYSNPSSGYPWCGWTFIRERHFGGRFRPTDVFIGTGVSIIASSGIRPAASAPIGGRALPRNGVASGTAVPRGSAVPRAGTAVADPRGGSDGVGTLGAVPNARPRRIPTEPVKAAGSTGSTRSRGSEGSVPGSSGSSGSPGSEPRTARPRGSDQQPPAASGRQEPPVTGRPVRQRTTGGAQPEAASPYRAPDAREAMPRSGAGDSAAAPRVRDREALPRPSWSAPASPPDSLPPPIDRRARPRDTAGASDAVRPAPPSYTPPPASARPAPREPAPHPRGGEPRRGGDDARPRGSESFRAPSPSAPPAAGGGRERAQSRQGDQGAERHAVPRVAPPASAPTAAPAPTRRRGGG